MIKTLIKNYFTAWNMQDINALKMLVTEDISLKDWELEVNGIEDFIIANKKIFSDNIDINADVQNITVSDKSCFALIKLKVESSHLDVIDYFTLRDNKINKIQAFRCF